MFINVTRDVSAKMYFKVTVELTAVTLTRCYGSTENAGPEMQDQMSPHENAGPVG